MVSSLGSSGQPWLSETLSQNNKRKKKTQSLSLARKTEVDLMWLHF